MLNVKNLQISIETNPKKISRLTEIGTVMQLIKY